jgi:predicted HD phosphohydrolase
MALAPISSVDELLTALESIDGMPTEDVVAALPHLLQTAEVLQTHHDDDPELVAAGLVHDLASALEVGCPDHAAAGAALVRPLLGARVAELVAGHADAKRYLVTVEPGYMDGLSANSTFTLVGQGGEMGVDEVAAFASRAEVGALVALRQADDSAKNPAAATRPVEAWRPLLERVAAATALPVSSASPTRSSG